MSGGYSCAVRDPAGLGSVTTLPDTDAWAVGQGPSGTLTLHWNGSALLALA